MHFSCLVIHKQDELVEYLLEPFGELDLLSDEIEYDERAKFSAQFTTEEAKEKAWEYKCQYPHKANEYSDTDDFMLGFYGYSYNENESCYGYWYNPNVQWDWWVEGEGSRFKDFFILKDGSKTDSALKCEIDWEKMEEDNKEDAIKHWERLEQLGINWDARKGESKEEYINRVGKPITHAVISEGEWYELDDYHNEKEWSELFKGFANAIDSIKISSRWIELCCNSDGYNHIFILKYSKENYSWVLNFIQNKES